MLAVSKAHPFEFADSGPLAIDDSRIVTGTKPLDIALSNDFLFPQQYCDLLRIF